MRIDNQNCSTEETREQIALGNELAATLKEAGTNSYEAIIDTGNRETPSLAATVSLAAREVRAWLHKCRVQRHSADIVPGPMVLL